MCNANIEIKREHGQILVTGLVGREGEPVNIIGLASENRRIIDNKFGHDLVVEYFNTDDRGACVLIKFVHTGPLSSLRIIYLADGEIEKVEIDPWKELRSMLMRQC